MPEQEFAVWQTFPKPVRVELLEQFQLLCPLRLEEQSSIRGRVANPAGRITDIVIWIRVSDLVDQRLPEEISLMFV